MRQENRGVEDMAEAADDVKQMMERFLAKQLCVIHTVPAAPRSELDKVLRAHLEHQIRLEKAGIMFAAGPMVNEDGTPGGGLIVIRAESFAAAKAIADSDPYHSAGLRTYTLRRWTVNEGSYTVRVNYSDQSVTVE
jgi:uncharacterized protein